METWIHSDDVVVRVLFVSILDLPDRRQIVRVVKMQFENRECRLSGSTLNFAARYFLEI